MFEYLAQQDVVDSEADMDSPPLIVFPVRRTPPPEVLYDPVLTGGGVANGCWALEHWDDYENIGIYTCVVENSVTMSFEEASEYLARDW